MSDIRRVLVVGGGVGGLTAAATFARRGVEVVLIERRPAFDIPGVGLGQPANALRVYDTLGVLDQILATGFSYDRMHLFDPGRRLIVEHKFLLGDDRMPAFCALSRLQLHEILLGAAERAGAQVRLGVTVSEIHDDMDRVDVQFSTGQRELVRSPGRLRRHTIHHPAPSGGDGVRAPSFGLRRLAGAGAPTG